MKRVLLAHLLLLFCFVAFSQDDDSPVEEQAPAQLDKDKIDEMAPKERISKIQQFLQPFEYDRDRVRDPFETQANNAPLSPGQVYGPFLVTQENRLSEFELKGLLWQTKNPVAVFRNPAGQVFRLKVKDYIGENFGYIATIRENEVVVIQTIEENNRRYSTTKVVFLDKK